jgi:hypothetical protein
MMCECKPGKCLLMVIYPNTNANIACDLDCYLTYGDQTMTSEERIELYKREHPKLFKQCVNEK